MSNHNRDLYVYFIIWHTDKNQTISVEYRCVLVWRGLKPCTSSFKKLYSIKHAILFQLKTKNQKAEFFILFYFNIRQLSLWRHGMYTVILSGTFNSNYLITGRTIIQHSHSISIFSYKTVVLQICVGGMR